MDRARVLAAPLRDTYGEASLRAGVHEPTVVQEHDGSRSLLLLRNRMPEPLCGCGGSRCITRNRSFSDSDVPGDYGRTMNEAEFGLYEPALVGPSGGGLVQAP